MAHIDGCQIPGYQRAAIGKEEEDQPASPIQRFKRRFARPWNYRVKPQLKKAARLFFAWKVKLQTKGATEQVADLSVEHLPLEAGDVVRVRSRQEIETTLDPFKEFKGCAFLEGMWQYCDTQQRVLQPVRRFLDERDYQVKRTRGVVLLEGVLCQGTPVFGRCDRACHLFWREEWLEKIEG